MIVGIGTLIFIDTLKKTIDMRQILVAVSFLGSFSLGSTLKQLLTVAGHFIKRR